MNIINFDQAANPFKEYIETKYETFINNANSDHFLGYEAKKKIDNCKKTINKLFPFYEEIEFVPGGGTLANKRAILDAVNWRPKRLNKNSSLDIILMSSIEHKSIYHTINNELINRGYNIIKIPVNASGQINLEKLKEIIETNKDRIALITIMNVNNEIGIKQPL